MTNIAQGADQDSEFPPENELDLKRLFQTIWQTRKFVSVVVVLVTLASLAGVFFLRAVMPVEQVFQHQISFTFDGVENQRYPNGTKFNLSDLTAPAVLGSVYENNSLAKHNIKLDEFLSWVSVVPYSPNFNNVIARYAGRLSDKKLSFAERLVIEKDQETELKKLQSQSALIRLTMFDRVGLSKELGEKIVRDIAAVWAKISMENRGVLKQNLGYDTTLLVSDELFGSLDQIVAIDLLRSSFTRMDKRIVDVSEISGALTIADEKSGFTIRSLQREISNLKVFRLNELSILALEFGLSQYPDRTKLYFEKKLEALLQTQQSYKLKAASTKLSLQDYVRESSTVVSGVQPNGSAGGSVLGGGTTIAQYGDAFLEKIVNLTQQSSDQKFRQQMTEDRLNFLRNEIDLSAEIANTREIIAKLNPVAMSSKSGTMPNFEKNKEYVQVELPRMASELNRYWEILSRIHEQLSLKKLSYNGTLYRDIILPSKLAYSANHPVLNTRIFILVMVTVIAAAFIAMFISLFGQILRSRN